MPQLPTLPQYFIAHYYTPALVELSSGGMSRSEVLLVALNRFQACQGFQIHMSERTLFRHLKAEARGGRMAD